MSLPPQSLSLGRNTPRIGDAPNGSAARRTINARFLVIDDHPVVSFALSHIIASHAGWEVVQQVTFLQDAKRLCEADCPNVALLDLILPGECGLEFLSWASVRRPSMRCVVYSIQPDSIYASTCIRAGAAGYVGKQASVESLVATIEQVLDGHLSVNGRVLDRDAVAFVRGRQTEGIESLSQRELEVLNLLGQGLSNRRIAEVIHRSAKTVETHRYRISRKLNVPNGPELVHFALQHRLANEQLTPLSPHNGV